MDSVEYRIYQQQVGEWRYLLDQSVTWSFVSDLIKGTITGYYVDKLFTQYSDYVVNLIYYPVKLSYFADMGALQTTLVIGDTTVNYSCKPVIKEKAYVEIGNFELSRTFDNFLDYSPYTRVTLHMPYFDEIIIPLVTASYLYKYYIYMSLDINNGKASLYIVLNGKVIATKESQIGIAIAIGKSNKEEQTRNNVLQAISAIGSGIGLYMGVATGNPLITAGSVGLLTKNLTSAINNNVDRITSYKASSGNRSSLCVDKSIFLTIEQPSLPYSPSAHLKGKPCKQNVTLSSISGYTEIGEIHFNPDGNEIYDDEINEIVELLKSGVILP